MAVELWIDDGNPWWMSPDIWAVPSDDPNDPPGMPFENIQAYVWAMVHNRGSTAVSNATVRYYWADPSTSITRASAHLIGTSSVNLAAGESKPVLCVTPWLPQYVNGGHECLIAEAFAPSDPLPPHTPSDPFNVPTDRHVAQRNISVGKAAAAMMLVHPFAAATDFGDAGDGGDLRLMIVVERADIQTLEPLIRSIGLRRLPEEAPEFEGFGVQPFRCGDALNDVGERKIEVQLPPRRRAGLALAVRTPGDLEDGQGALFLVRQFQDDREVGGIALLVLGEAGDPDMDHADRERPRAVRAIRPEERID